MLMRALLTADRGAVSRMLVECGVFSGEEIAAALEIFDSGEYALFGADVDGVLAGYVCVARIELTRSTWYVYWLCVDGRWQRRGVATGLMAHAEEYVRAQGGERLVLETSGRADYAGARAFYEKAGFAVVGRIADYYKAGDDCVYYCKVIG
ncbi:MAG: GNAT family N-acetyltransferase [Acidobacteria bacterium]|nr:GNAT family N-acetyltransferase [Acidobacteriota bacterium]